MMMSLLNENLTEGAAPPPTQPAVTAPPSGAEGGTAGAPTTSSEVMVTAETASTVQAQSKFGFSTFLHTNNRLNMHIVFLKVEY